MKFKNIHSFFSAVRLPVAETQKAIVLRKEDKIDYTKPPKKRALVESKAPFSLLPMTLPKAPIVKERKIRTDIVYDAEKSLIAVVRKNKGTKLTKEARERKKKRSRKKKRESIDDDSKDENDENGEEEKDTKIEESETKTTNSNLIVGGEVRDEKAVPIAMRPKVYLDQFGNLKTKTASILVNTGDAANKSLQAGASAQDKLPQNIGSGIYISSAMFKKKIKARRWTTHETRTFYGGLQQCGLNFGMIARLFPDRSRKQIVKKFKREEKQHPNLVEKALRTRKPMNTQIFKHNVDLDPESQEKDVSVVVNDGSKDVSTQKRVGRRKRKKNSSSSSTTTSSVMPTEKEGGDGMSLRRSKRIRSISQSSQV